MARAGFGGFVAFAFLGLPGGLAAFFAALILLLLPRWQRSVDLLAVLISAGVLIAVLIPWPQAGDQRVNYASRHWLAALLANIAIALLATRTTQLLYRDARSSTAKNPTEGTALRSSSSDSRAGVPASVRRLELAIVGSVVVVATLFLIVGWLGSTPPWWSSVLDQLSLGHGFTMASQVAGQAHGVAKYSTGRIMPVAGLSAVLVPVGFIMVCSLGATAVGTLRLARRFTSARFAVLAVACLCVLPGFWLQPLPFAMASAFALWAIIFTLDGRAISAAVLVGLAGLCRPEALLLALPLGVVAFKAVTHLRKEQWRALIALLVLLITVLPWALHMKSTFSRIAVSTGLGIAIGQAHLADSQGDQGGAAAIEVQTGDSEADVAAAHLSQAIKHPGEYFGVAEVSARVLRSLSLSNPASIAKSARATGDYWRGWPALWVLQGALVALSAVAFGFRRKTPELSAAPLWLVCIPLLGVLSAAATWGSPNLLAPYLPIVAISFALAVSSFRKA